MGRYIDWEDVIDRYPALESVGGADSLSSSYIVYAEAYLDSSLASHYVTPFSQEIMLVKDLAIDYTYWRAARFKLDDAVEVKSSFFETIEMLKNGQLIMTDENGIEIPATSRAGGFYSTTASYTNAFGMDDILDQGIDPDLVEDTTDRRSY